MSHILVMIVVVVDCVPTILENRTHIEDILEGDGLSQNDEFNGRKIPFWVSSVFKIKFIHWDERTIVVAIIKRIGNIIIEKYC